MGTEDREQQEGRLGKKLIYTVGSGLIGAASLSSAITGLYFINNSIHQDSPSSTLIMGGAVAVLGAFSFATGAPFLSRFFESSKELFNGNYETGDFMNSTKKDAELAAAKTKVQPILNYLQSVDPSGKFFVKQQEFADDEVQLWGHRIGIFRERGPLKKIFPKLVVVVSESHGIASGTSAYSFDSKLIKECQLRQLL